MMGATLRIPIVSSCRLGLRSRIEASRGARHERRLDRLTEMVDAPAADWHDRDLWAPHERHMHRRRDGVDVIVEIRIALDEVHVGDVRCADTEQRCAAEREI